MVLKQSFGGVGIGSAPLNRLATRYTMKKAPVSKALSVNYILMFRNKANKQSFEKRELAPENVGAAMLKGYRVIDDFVGTRNGVSARYVVLARTISTQAWLQYKALKLAEKSAKKPTPKLEEKNMEIKALEAQNKAWLKAEKELDTRMEMADDEQSFGEGEVIQGYFEDSFCGHK